MTPGAEALRWRRALARHASLRWVGVALFVVAAGVAVWSVGLVFTAGLPWTKVVPCLLGLGLSLGAFGANDDSVVHAMDALQREHALPPAFAGELAQERAARPDRLVHAHYSPKAALILPLIAGGLVAFLGVRAATWTAPDAGDSAGQAP